MMPCDEKCEKVESIYCMNSSGTGMIRTTTRFRRCNKDLEIGMKLSKVMPESSPVTKVRRTELARELRCQFSYAFKVGHHIMPLPISFSTCA
jgi:hypothetical protein